MGCGLLGFGAQKVECAHISGRRRKGHRKGGAQPQESPFLHRRRDVGFGEGDVIPYFWVSWGLLGVLRPIRLGWVVEWGHGDGWLALGHGLDV